MKQFYIYAIYDPRDGTCRYIGKGQGKRAYAHLSAPMNRRLDAMIMECEKAGLTVPIKIIERFAKEQAALWYESELIRRQGHTLFNISGNPHVKRPRWQRKNIRSKRRNSDTSRVEQSLAYRTSLEAKALRRRNIDLETYLRKRNIDLEMYVQILRERFARRWQ